MAMAMAMHMALAMAIVFDYGHVRVQDIRPFKKKNPSDADHHESVTGLRHYGTRKSRVDLKTLEWQQWNPTLRGHNAPPKATRNRICYWLTNRATGVGAERVCEDGDVGC